MAREMVGLRLSQDGLVTIDQMGSDTGAARAVVIRVLLGEALRSKPIRDAATARLQAMRDTL